MSKDILVMAEVISNEKELPQETIFKAIEEALESATKRRFNDDVRLNVVIDRKTGYYQTYRCWDIVSDEFKEDESFNLDQQMTLSEAQQYDANLQVGDVYQQLIESIEFGRIAAQTAKQVIAQKVREAERQQMADYYQSKVGQLIGGVVKHVGRDSIVLDLNDGAEAVIPRSQMLPRESARINDRLRAYLYEIKETAKGPQLLASRTCPEMLSELFRTEVPEIAEDVIEIKAVARDPGWRAKMAVKTNDGRLDPIGACIGMRGARVQAVSNELGGERVDVIFWDDNPAQLIINAMAPAEVVSIVIDEDSKTMDIAVADDQLSQAIGRSGQNVRLASELSGWELNVMSESDAQNKNQQEAATLTEFFKEHLEVDDDVAGVLVEEGFTSLQEVAYVPMEEFLNIEGFDEEMVEELRERAKEALQTVSSEDSKVPAEDLFNMEGITPALAYRLAAQGIVTREDLAEQAVVDLVDDVGLEEDKAAELIMKAREPWFQQAGSDNNE